MLEEANPQAGTVGRTFDQTRNVSDNEALPAVDTDHAQVRHQRGERIVRHFRLGGRHRTDKGTFTGVRQAQQTDVGQHFHFQLQVTLLARLARRSLAWRAVGTGLESSVTQAVPAAMSHQQALSGLDQVTDDFLGAGVDHRGTHRYAQLQILALLAGAIGAATVGTALGIEVTGVTVVDQGVEVFVGDHIDRAAITAITAVRATILNEFFPAKAHAAIATITCFYPDRHFINKLHI
ncbi:hypothetical protein D9M71_499150 [compost metagenome]